ncbi:sensor domain-containing diguanylate cyclase [Tsukamurella pseudospumae]|uniref:Diguanylate cyclase n=1 Tax=Tsukamurella pseudospumae TaxID=239498 RepID=A0A138AUT5_9ACTN|nr:diguanylate cyclase [Tsukamurella pseudospumae]KXP00547.1 hypothetical protein AXK61_15265 [Tsukamurella pseudospumae]KXP14215.1 hypothetical protein AXK60_21260 [Tsukamurella pseudospumae]
MDGDGEIERLRAMIDESTRSAEDRGLATLRMLQAIADAAPDLVFVKDLEGRYVFLNAAAAKVKGAPVEEVLGRDDTDFFGPAFAARLMATDRAIMSSGTAREVEETPVVEGRVRTFMSLKAPYRGADGAVIGLIGISRDVTESRRAAAELENARARWQFVVDVAGDGVAEWDLTSGEVFLSARWKAVLGYAGHEDEIGSSPVEWERRVHSEDLTPALAAVWRHLRGETPSFSFEHRLKTRSGEWLWGLGQGRVTERGPDGRPLRIVSMLTDISPQVIARRAAAREVLKLGRLVELDDLTGIANRRGFGSALDEAWRTSRGGDAVHVAVIDVDDFKGYNDARGHGAGDAALQSVAGVLARAGSAVRSTAARLGGDEFGLVIEGPVDLPALLEQVRADVLALGLTHDGARPVSVSCGGASGSIATSTAAQLLGEADRRLYRAKGLGRNRVVVG